MSAIAQYLQGTGLQVAGSDRFFNEGKADDIKQKLEAEGIVCFPQNGEGINTKTDLIVVSTAIEDTVIEVKKAKEMGIPIIRRSELLALIATTKKTIAIGGTSGKSTTTGMLFAVMRHAGKEPSVISGAGLVDLIKKGKIGNAFVGKGEWLIIEADESDGSIVQYHPEIGVLLNIEKDHKELDELIKVFEVFRDNSKLFIVNQSNLYSSQLSVNIKNDFSVEDNIIGTTPPVVQDRAVQVSNNIITGSSEQSPSETDNKKTTIVKERDAEDHSSAEKRLQDQYREEGFQAVNFNQRGFQISFTINGQHFTINILGKHNMENAAAAVAAASFAGVSLADAATALENYEGIYRRTQVLGEKHGVWVVDDFAHNPVKCAAAIKACQPVSDKVVAWLQPHGYTPTKFLRKEFVTEITNALRENDEIWMSEIFYAGGTATKDISALDLINDIKAKGKKAYFVEDRKLLLSALRNHLPSGTTLLLMGARDPSLEQFSKELYKQL